MSSKHGWRIVAGKYGSRLVAVGVAMLVLCATGLSAQDPGYPSWDALDRERDKRLPPGKVYANDIDAERLGHLERRAAERNLRNIVRVVGDVAESHLERHPGHPRLRR
jgi:hypothetical protein